MWETWYTVSLVLAIPTFVTAVVVGVVAILSCFCPERYKSLKECVKCCDTNGKETLDEVEGQEQNDGNAECASDREPLISSRPVNDLPNNDIVENGKVIVDVGTCTRGAGTSPVDVATCTGGASTDQDLPRSVNSDYKYAAKSSASDDEIKRASLISESTDSMVKEWLPSAGRLAALDDKIYDSDEPYTSIRQPLAVSPVSTSFKYELSKEELQQLIVKVSSYWNKHRKKTMLKVLLCDFKIPITDIQETNEVFNLFMLLRATGDISESNIDIVVEAAILCGLDSIEKVIRESIKGYPKFRVVTLHNFSRHRRNLISFGDIISVNNLNKVVNLFDLKFDKNADVWDRIFELEIRDILTLEKNNSFVEKLLDNEMTREAAALNTF